MSLLPIWLAYDIFQKNLYFDWNIKVKKAKLKLKFIIYLAHDYKDRQITKQTLEEISN